MAIIIGTEFDENLFGTEDDDTIFGLGGADFILGLGGNDTIDGGAGNDFVDGGTGDDIIHGGASTGTFANGDFQVLNGGNGVDTIFGGEGEDLINLQPTNNANTGVGETAFGGGGDDVIRNTSGGDLLDGGDGVDRVSYFNIGAAITLDLMLQGAAQDTGGGGFDTLVSIENISGTAFNDTIRGDDSANQINANAGDDLVEGRGGDDVLIGDGDAIGNDTLDGGSGVDTVSYSPNLFETARTEGVFINLLAGFAGSISGGETDTLISIENVEGTDFDDQIIGDNSNNTLSGLAGNDFIDGRGGDDIIHGGASTGTFANGDFQVLFGGEGVDTIFGGDSDDLINLQPTNNVNTGVGETAFGGGGDDLVRSTSGGDYIDGGDGVDRVTYFFVNSAVTVDLNIQGIVQNTGGGGMDTLTGVENVSGSQFNDTLTGGVGDNLFFGNGGDDVIEGRDGDDVIVATVDDGNDMVVGGAGIDTYDLSGTSAGAWVNLHYTFQQGTPAGTSISSETGTDSLSGIEDVIGSSGDDTMVGSDAANVLSGGVGDDFLMGMEGDDTLIGGDGDDFLKGDYFPSGVGPIGNNTLIGGAGDDTMWGGAGVDSYDGGGEFDRVSFFDYKATQGAVASLITQTISNDGFGNVETMVSVEGLGGGTAFADHFTGDDNANIFVGDAGDTLIANGGDDQIQLGGVAGLLDGGAGIDSVNFGSGGTLVVDSNGDGLAEFVETTAGVEVNLIAGFMFDGFGNGGTIANVENVDGTEFDDFLMGDNGANTLNGLGGADLIQGRGGDDAIRGGEGDDHLAGESISSSYNGPFGNDALFGEGGDDLLRGGAGVDSFDGGVGQDRVSFFTRAATQGAIANLATQTISNDGFGNAETMVSIENLGAGTAFADHLTGDDNDNFLLGEMGDTLLGAGGNDSFQLGGGPALLDGGAGIDTITGFFGDFGSLFPDSNGDGLAEIVFATSGVTVNLLTGQILNDGFGLSGTLVSIENLNGSAFADTLTGDNGDNILGGLDGNDVIDGGKGNDQIAGDAGDDVLAGGKGVDRLSGGAGNDTLDGGAQDDTFLFAPGGGLDTVRDFDANPGGGGQDMLDISAFGITAGDFAARVAIADLGAHMQVTIDGADVITLLGVNGNGQNIITVNDFILAS